MHRNNHIGMLPLTVLLLSALVPDVASAQNNVIDEVVWVVGDDAIYKSEVEEARQEAQLRGSRFDGDPYCIIPEQLAINKLFMNQAELDSVTATDDQVTQQLNYYYNEMVNQAGSEEKLEEYRSMNATQIKERLYEQIYQEIVVSQVRSSIMEKVKVTPADVRRYIREAPADEIPNIPSQVEVQIITIDPVIPQEEIDEVKRELREYTERVQNGEIPFSTLARMYSEDGSARNGGDLGFKGRGELVPEFAAVAFNLTDPEKVSKIVETEYGYHIIQLIERLGDRVRVRHILKKPGVPSSSVEESLAKLDTIAQDIRAGRKSFEESVLLYSQDKETKNNKGIMSNRPDKNSIGVSKFQMQELLPDIAKVVDRMHVGEISDPFPLQLLNGHVTCAVVKLKSKTTAHKANMSDDYEILYDMVTGIRREEALDKWIREKQKTTYVKISQGWNDCEFRYPGWGQH